MTVSFSHLDPGFAPEHWDELIAGLPDLTTPAGPGRPLVVLAAHPDDETLGAGGLIAAVGAAGGDITVIVASDGEGSHPDSPTHRPAQLAARRRAELTEAVRTLAPRARIQRLGLPDGHLDEHRAAIAAAIDEAAALGAMLVTPWWGDGHPDHTACARAAASTQTAATASVVAVPDLVVALGRLPPGRPRHRRQARAHAGAGGTQGAGDRLLPQSASGVVGIAG